MTPAPDPNSYLYSKPNPNPNYDPTSPTVGVEMSSSKCLDAGTASASLTRSKYTGPSQSRYAVTHLTRSVDTVTGQSRGAALPPEQALYVVRFPFLYNLQVSGVRVRVRVGVRIRVRVRVRVYVYNDI